MQKEIKRIECFALNEINNQSAMHVTNGVYLQPQDLRVSSIK